MQANRKPGSRRRMITTGLPQRELTYTIAFTRHSEYHFLGNKCVKVKRRDLGRWLTSHPLLGKQLHGVYSQQAENKFTYDREPVVGGKLWFMLGQRSMLTSTVQDVRQRPWAPY